MRLITHNLLACNVKGCQTRFPLEITVGPDVEVPGAPRSALDERPPSPATIAPAISHTASEVDEAGLAVLVARIDWPAFVAGAGQLGIHGLPQQPPQGTAAAAAAAGAGATTTTAPVDWGLVRRALLEVSLRNGQLRCPGCKRVYPVTNGIPNMVLLEDEI
jgi:multifunctional methyltransferase subunit TRM112